jgi:phenylpyruvate tautomerase PptA (4-oxalocrotonate tautomerase family)
VSVPQGALSDRRRAGLVEEFSKLVREAAGLSEEEGIRIWVLVHEIAEGNWGAGGQIIRFEQLREAAKAERDKAGTPA